MSEKSDGPKITFKYSGESYQMRPDNSGARLHSEVPETDHFIVMRRGVAVRAFRAIFPMFDKWAQFMAENGYTVENHAYPSDDTFTTYRDIYGEPDLHIRELTPREENDIAFETWLAEQELENES